MRNFVALLFAFWCIAFTVILRASSSPVEPSLTNIPAAASAAGGEGSGGVTGDVPKGNGENATSPMPEARAKTDGDGGEPTPGLTTREMMSKEEEIKSAKEKLAIAEGQLKQAEEEIIKRKAESLRHKSYLALQILFQTTTKIAEAQQENDNKKVEDLMTEFKANLNALEAARTEEIKDMENKHNAYIKIKTFAAALNVVDSKATTSAPLSPEIQQKIDAHRNDTNYLKGQILVINELKKIRPDINFAALKTCLDGWLEYEKSRPENDMSIIKLEQKKVIAEQACATARKELEALERDKETLLKETGISLGVLPTKSEDSSVPEGADAEVGRQSTEPEPEKQQIDEPATPTDLMKQIKTNEKVINSAEENKKKVQEAIDKLEKNSDAKKIEICHDILKIVEALLTEVQDAAKNTDNVLHQFESASVEAGKVAKTEAKKSKGIKDIFKEAGKPLMRFFQSDNSGEKEVKKLENQLGILDELVSFMSNVREDFNKHLLEASYSLVAETRKLQPVDGQITPEFEQLSILMRQREELTEREENISKREEALQSELDELKRQREVFEQSKHVTVQDGQVAEIEALRKQLADAEMTRDEADAKAQEFRKALDQEREKIKELETQRGPVDTDLQAKLNEANTKITQLTTDLEEAKKNAVEATKLASDQTTLISGQQALVNDQVKLVQDRQQLDDDKKKQAAIVEKAKASANYMSWFWTLLIINLTAMGGGIVYILFMRHGKPKV